MNKKSNDHWVSQFLLKFFVRGGQLWIYDKTTKRRIRRPTKAICCEEGFTTFSPDEIPPEVEILKDGKFLEIELSKLEREQSLTIAKLIEHRTIEAISAEEFWELVRFAVRLYLCNPAHRTMLRQGWSELHLLNIRSLSGPDLDNLSLKFFGMYLPHDYFRKQLEIAAAKEELLQSEFLGLALKSAESIFDLVMKEFAWSLADCKNLGAVLCTSDRPVLLGGKALSDPVGFSTPEVTLFFPLSPDLCLTGRNVGKSKRFLQHSHIITNPDFLGMPTLLTWAKSNQYIIATEKNRIPNKYVVAAKLKQLPAQLKKEILKRHEEKIAVAESETFSIQEYKHKERRLVVTYSESRAAKDRWDRERLLKKLREKLKNDQTDTRKLVTNRGYLKFTNEKKSGQVVLNEDKIAEDGKWDGLHGLITNDTEAAPSELISRYRRLWVIEESFRLNKHTLAMRPIYHFKAERIKAHVLICCLAFALSRYLQLQMKHFDVKMSMEEVRDELLQVESSILKPMITFLKSSF